MYSQLLNRVQRQWLISIVLVALGVRALIPAGFMPSADRPFTLEICPDGFPAQLLHNGSQGAANIGPHAGHDMHGEPTAHHAGAVDHAAGDSSQHSGSHEHGAARAEHCVFAAVASVSPPPSIPWLLTALESVAAPQSEPFHAVIELTRYRVQQPRAPPALS